MSFPLVGQGAGRRGGGEWRGNWLSRTVCRGERSVRPSQEGERARIVWLPGGHRICVPLAGPPDLVSGSVSQYDSVDAPQLLPFRLTQNTHLNGTLSPYPSLFSVCPSVSSLYQPLFPPILPSSICRTCLAVTWPPPPPSIPCHNTV